jgi:hypothetical protein
MSEPTSPADPFQTPPQGAPQQPGYGYPQPPGYGPPPPAKPTNGLAVAALVVGLIALLICWVPVIGILAGLVALGLGIAGWVRASRTGTGTGLAVAGTVLGGLAVIAGILATVVLVSIIGTAVDCDQPGLTDDEVAQCIEDELTDRLR